MHMMVSMAILTEVTTQYYNTDPITYPKEKVEQQTVHPNTAGT